MHHHGKLLLKLRGNSEAASDKAGWGNVFHPRVAFLSTQPSGDHMPVAGRARGKGEPENECKFYLCTAKFPCTPACSPSRQANKREASSEFKNIFQQAKNTQGQCKAEPVMGVAGKGVLHESLIG